ncbi:MAG: peptidoglycan DD-metalloendopeptidase family protein [Candidatus Nomurabacteria bacterium]
MTLRSFSLSIIITILTIPLFIHAQTADELQANINSLSTKIQALDKEIADFNKKISQTQGEAKTLKQALASLELRRTALNKEIDLSKLKIVETQGKISNTQSKIYVTENTLDKNKRALSEALRSLVNNEQSLPPLINALSPGSHLSDTLNAAKQGEDVSKAINEKVKTLAETKTTLATQKAVYETSKQKLEDLNSALIDQKQLVEVTSKDKNDLLAKTKNKEIEYQKLLSDKKNKRESLEAEMSDVESKLKVIVDITKLPKYGKGVLKYPLANPVITQYFGNTVFASGKYNGAGHNGIDFGAKIGTPILSADTGIVIGTGNTDTACRGVSYGKWILIRHTNGLTTLYGHLSVIQATAGQSVVTGQKIALSGNTGYATGPHLHFTVYASDTVHVTSPTEYKSKVCGTYLIMPISPKDGYLNPLPYL